MTESSLKASTRDAIEHRCVGAEVLHHQDRFSSGYPDTSVSWNGFTSWVEFKFLGLEESLHGPLREDQLLQLIRLEKQSACRAWIVVFRKTRLEERTDIYRPTRLVSHGVKLELKASEKYSGLGPSNLVALWDTGVVSLSGLQYDAVASLIKLTHQ